MSEQTKLNIQDAFLNAVRRSNNPVSIHITNGYVIKNALVRSFDSYAVLAEADGRQMLVYKHAISTVTPEKPVELSDRTGEKNDR